MAQSTTFVTKQGTTIILPFECSMSDGSSQDFTGWKVAFMVRADHQTPAAQAIFNSGDLNCNAVGYVECVIGHLATLDWQPGTYIAGARVYDANGYYAYTDALTFIIQDAAYEDGIS